MGRPLLRPAGPACPVAADEPLSLRQLEVLTALVDYASFTRAARALGLSQSTVSGHIAELEQRLALRLVDRDRSGVKPTPAGRSVLRHAREALRAELHVRMAAAELSGSMQGVLVLGASTIPAVYLVPRYLARFRAENPKVRVEVRTGDSRDVTEMVAQGEADAGIVGSEPRTRGVDSEPVGSDHLVLVTRPDDPLLDRNPLTVDDIQGLPLVVREVGSGTRDAMLQGLGLSHAPQRLQVALEVGSTEAVKAAVKNGLGPSFVSDLAARDDLAAGTLVQVEVEGFDVERTFWLAVRDGSRIPPVARAFRDAVRAERSVV